MLPKPQLDLFQLKEDELPAHSDLIGGSSCERVMNCTGSVALSKQMPPQPQTKYMGEGTMLHSVMEKCLNEEVEPWSLIGYEEAGCTLTKELVEELADPALNSFRTIKPLYGEIEFEIEARVSYQDIDAFGTCDIVGFNDRYTIIIDWKFGRGVPVSAIDNHQLKFYAGAARETPGLKDMFDRDRPILLAIIQPAADEAMTVDLITHEELDNFVYEMKTAVDNVLNDTTDIVSGKWCRFCQGAPICPVKKSLAEELISKDVLGVDRGELASLIKLAKEAADWSKSVLGFAHQELERGKDVEGYKLIAKRATRSWRSEEKVEELFGELGLTGDAIKESKLISPAKAEKLFKRLGQPTDALDKQIRRTQVGTTMAAADDKRPAVTGKYEASNLALPKQT
tara:strand:- start:2426 stop:3616 length:1191 start_codon:yes stop_codon:yes gene_type:complete